MLESEVKLFRTWSSPFSLRVVWAVKLKGVGYATILEDLATKSPSLLQYNLIHKKVPVLIHDENTLANQFYMKICLGTLPIDIIMNGIGCLDGPYHHDIHYVDRTHVKTGLLLTETLRMDSTIQIPNYIFGCGMDNIDRFDGIGSGVISLGVGPKSIATQLGHLSGKKFSHCLLPLDLPARVSHIHFEDQVAIQGPGTVMVPLVLGRPGNFYHVTLEAFTVTRTRIPFTGNSSAAEQDWSLQLQSVVANFRGGNVPLKRFNAFVTWGSVTCLAFGVNERFIAYGSLAQQDFLVGFDQYAMRVSFKPFQCSHA
uniref:GST N-terminal domain-containing protein n=1 Tax=Kalanchoe fedtschenkoi TaxID=63787 RepID=A0A7N0TFY1_KALFE